MANFSTVVELYRLSSKPSFDGRSFSATVELNTNILNLVNSLVATRNAYGCFEDIEINGNLVDEDELNTITIAAGNILSYTFIPPKNGAERFYDTVVDFLSINSLKKG